MARRLVASGDLIEEFRHLVLSSRAWSIKGVKLIGLLVGQPVHRPGIPCIISSNVPRTEKI